MSDEKLRDFVSEGYKSVFFVSPFAKHPILVNYVDGKPYDVAISSVLPKRLSSDEAIYLFGDEITLPEFSAYIDEKGSIHLVTAVTYYKTVKEINER